MKSLIFLFLILLVSCTTSQNSQSKPQNSQHNTQIATFAGGCFWCIEAAFEELDGVLDVISGYSGGDKENPTYKEVSTGQTNYLEAVQITYNPQIISYKELLDTFWRQIDPTDDGGQFVDRGSQYKTAIFYHNKDQKQQAEESKKQLQKSGRFEKPIVTQILQYKSFYKAEEYHQDYYKKRYLQYNLYKEASGREKLKNIWKE